MATDVNASLGTVTNDPANTLNWTSPTNVNDGSDSTSAFVAFHGSGFTFRLISDLGVACDIASMSVRTGYGSMEVRYSTDGAIWNTLPGITWTPAVGGWFNITWTGGAITARYWRIGRTAAGFGAREDIQTWSLLGDAPVDELNCAFSATPTFGPAPLEVDFTDLTEGVPDGWSWDFGDGGTSTSQNPTHTYTVPGVYDVTLTATRSGDLAECDTTIVAYITVVSTTAGVFMDWEGDGFDPETDDNVSSNVVRWTISRGSGPEITGGSQPGSATLILKNPDDTYNPRNEASDLYPNLRDGTPVWIGPNSDGVLTGPDARGLFGGRVTDITLIPSPGTDEPATVEFVCEDALGWYQRTPVSLDYVEGRSHEQLRGEALADAGETRFDLAHEITTMPLSHADGDLRSVLDNINAVNGTRHFIKPSDSYPDWYDYTTRNRQYKLAGVADETVTASVEHATDTSGWRLSADTVINRQKATVTPIKFTPATFTVWEADALPFDVTDIRPYTRIVDFDDVVSGSSLDIASTGDTITATYTPFASGGKIELTVGAGDSATVQALSIEGRLARRLEQQSAVADDLTSQAAPRGIREGSEVGNEYLGVIASAQGIADHVVWRYGSPQLRPTLTIVNWLPEQFELDLYDVIAFTSTHLGMDAVLFEIVGLTHEGEWAAATGQVLHTVTYVLQESRVQAAYEWFTLDVSRLAPGATADHHLAY